MSKQSGGKEQRANKQSNCRHVSIRRQIFHCECSIVCHYQQRYKCRCPAPSQRNQEIPRLAHFHHSFLCVLCVLCGLSFHARKVMTRLTIISFSCGFDSAILLNVEMWKCCHSQCCQFQFQPPIFFFAVITLAERMRDRKTWGQTPRLRRQSA